MAPRANTAPHGVEPSTPLTGRVLDGVRGASATRGRQGPTPRQEILAYLYNSRTMAPRVISSRRVWKP